MPGPPRPANHNCFECCTAAAFWWISQFNLAGSGPLVNPLARTLLRFCLASSRLQYMSQMVSDDHHCLCVAGQWENSESMPASSRICGWQKGPGCCVGEAVMTNTSGVGLEGVDVDDRTAAVGSLQYSKTLLMGRQHENPRVCHCNANKRIKIYECYLGTSEGIYLHKRKLALKLSTQGATQGHNTPVYHNARAHFRHGPNEP